MAWARGCELSLKSDNVIPNMEKWFGVNVEQLSGLTELVREYEGLPSDQAREALVNLMRKKRSALSGGPEWAGAAEEEYNRLMRATDPWRVTELKPIAQTSIFLLGPVYIATLAVQQLVPALFNGAYAIGAAVLLGPLLFQILTG